MDEFHRPGGPPGWDPQLYGSWEDIRMLLTFVPSRMRSVVLMYKPMHLPPPNANPLGLRPVSLQRLMFNCCGSAQANSCSVGWQLVGACSHCVVALTLATVYPGHPNLLLPLTEESGLWTGRILNQWIFLLLLKSVEMNE